MHIPCREVRQGTVLLDASGQARVVVEVAPYVGPLPFVFGIARDATGWGCSLTDPGHAWAVEA